MNRQLLLFLLAFACTGVCSFAQVDTIYVVDTIDYVEEIEDPEYEAWLVKKRAWQTIATTLQVTTQIPQNHSLWLYANLWDQAQTYPWAQASLSDAQVRLRKYLRELQWAMGLEEDEPLVQRGERVTSPWANSINYQQGFYQIMHDHKTIDKPWWNEYGLKLAVERYFLKEHLVVEGGLGMIYRANRDEYSFDGVIFEDGATVIRSPNIDEAVFLVHADRYDQFRRFHYVIQVPLSVGFQLGIIQAKLGAEGQLRTRRNDIHRLWEQEWLGTAAISATFQDHYRVGIEGFRGVTPFFDHLEYRNINTGERFTLVSYRSGLRLELGYVF